MNKAESHKFGLNHGTIKKIQEVFLKHPKIQKIILYGSRAKGNFKSGSDIDITLIAPKMSLSELLQIEHEIDDLMLPYKMDLSLFHQIDNPSLIDHINRIGIEFA